VLVAPGDRALPPGVLRMMQRATILATMLRLLVRRFGCTVSKEMLIDHVYSGTEAPLQVRNGISVRISELRRALRPHGLEIVGSRYSAEGYGYRLQWAAVRVAAA
jgi:DNA-binding winged helix-turn-helix (wHTH) protein